MKAWFTISSFLGNPITRRKEQTVAFKVFSYVFENIRKYDIVYTRKGKQKKERDQDQIITQKLQSKLLIPHIWRSTDNCFCGWHLKHSIFEVRTICEECKVLNVGLESVVQLTVQISVFCFDSKIEQQFIAGHMKYSLGLCKRIEINYLKSAP